MSDSPFVVIARTWSTITVISVAAPAWKAINYSTNWPWRPNPAHWGNGNKIVLK